MSATDDTRKDVFRSIFNVSWENALRYIPKDLIGRAKNEKGMLAGGFINNIFSLLRNCIILISPFVIIINYDAVFAVIALARVPVLAFTYRFLMRLQVLLI